MDRKDGFDGQEGISLGCRRRVFLDQIFAGTGWLKVADTRTNGIMIRLVAVGLHCW